AAYGQVISSQENISVSLNGADRHAQNIMEAFVMEAYVQVAVAKHLNPRCATSGVVFKENCSTLAAAQPSVCDQRCGIGGRGADKIRLAAGAEAADRATVVDDRRAARGRTASEFRAALKWAGNRAAHVDKSTIARG